MNGLNPKKISEMLNENLEKVTINGTNIIFPNNEESFAGKFDDSDEAIQLYMSIYDIKTESKCNSYNRKVFQYPNIGKKGIECSGDIDFNFKMNKIEIFKKIINESSISNEKKIEILSRLYAVHNLTYHPNNLSMMPVNGGMNILKQSLGCDRLDTFVFTLSMYYSGADVFLLNAGNFKPVISYLLKDYLDSFGNIKNCCERIYHIPLEFVQELCENGKKAILTPKDVERYINLALKFWSYKQVYYESASSEIRKHYNNLLRVVCQAKEMSQEELKIV